MPRDFPISVAVFFDENARRVLFCNVFIRAELIGENADDILTVCLSQTLVIGARKRGGESVHQASLAGQKVLQNDHFGNALSPSEFGRKVVKNRLGIGG